MKKLIKKIIQNRFKEKSIKRQILHSFMFLICFLTITPICVLILSGYQTIKYDKIITNVSRANNLAQIVRTEIPDEIWKIVAGYKTFYEGDQYLLLKQTRKGIQGIQDSSKNQKNVQLLAVANRALDTLEKYINMLCTQIEEDSSVLENEAVLEEIRSVAALVDDLFQDYIVSEIEYAAIANETLKQTTQTISILLAVVLIISVGFALLERYRLSEKIRTAIQKLELFSTRIASGELNAQPESSNIDEFLSLTENLNTMGEKIQQLIDTNILEQKNLQKAQMQTLQAQITPHFLYNTLDTIGWLAEAGQRKEVVELAKAFASFFRISLSRGQDWITVGEEIAHIKSYLTVQEIRYRDILNYEIICDEKLYEYPILKLILQPLVENALYHGIKKRRGRGKLTVLVEKKDKFIHFSVHDNGNGMTEERLNEVLQELATDSLQTEKRSVYGLYNVNKRLCLYYNDESTLHIKSTAQKGTTVCFSVPAEYKIQSENYPEGYRKNV